MEKMQITKRVEKLYALKPYENIKIVYEMTQDVPFLNADKCCEELSEKIEEQFKKDEEKIEELRNPKPTNTPMPAPTTQQTDDLPF